MSNSKVDSFERAQLLKKAVSRWDNEGGACEGGHLSPTSVGTVTNSAALPLNNAEIAHLQARVIALENLVKVLLVDASEQQLGLMRDVAAYISPRPGSTQHSLTIHATACMINLVESAGHLGDLGLSPSGSEGSIP